MLQFFLFRNPFWQLPSKPSFSILVQKKELQQHVYRLTNTVQPRNAKNLKSLNEAGEYIKEQWRQIGFTVNEQRYLVANQTYQNLMVSFCPQKAPRVIVGAHYDVWQNQPGADDNASGIAGLLELSRLLYQQKPSLSYGIDFVAYTLEEPPYFATPHMGSAVHARSLKHKKSQIKAMIALEMIGYFSDKENSQRFPSFLASFFYPTKGNFIAIVSRQSSQDRKLTAHLKRFMAAASPLSVYSLNSSSMLGVDFSDHRNYWAEGYAAAMVTDTAFFRNPNYHKKTDTPQTLDYERMAEVIRGLYWAIIHFS